MFSWVGKVQTVS